MWNSLIQQMFGPASRDSVAIEIGTTAVKLAYVRVAGSKKELAGLLSRPAQGLSDADLGKFILDFIASYKIKSPELFLVVPSAGVITKNIEVPSTNPREIKEIISLQAGRHTPYSREEVIVDFVNLGTHKKNYTKILMVIVTTKQVKKHLEILEKNGLRVQKVFFAPEAMAWVSVRALRMDPVDPFGFIHIDSDSTDFMVMHKGRILFLRSVPVGKQQLTADKEKAQAKFTEEIKKSLEAYQGEDIEKTPTALYVGGASAGLSYLELLLNSTLHLPVKPVEYARGVTAGRQAAEYLAQESTLSFFAPVAGLMARKETRVDLIPEEIKLKKILQQRGRDLIAMGFLCMSIFVLVMVILTVKWYFKSSYLETLDKKYQSLHKDAQVLENDFNKISLVKNYQSGQGYPLNVLGELVEQVPMDLEINEIRYDSQGKFSTKGTASSMSTVFSFVDNLNKSKYFKEVKTKYTTKRKEEGKDVVDFEITSLLNTKVQGQP